MGSTALKSSVVERWQMLLHPPLLLLELPRLVLPQDLLRPLVLLLLLLMRPLALRP